MEEAVISAKEALDAAGVKNYKFEFSHARLLQLIFEELDLPAVKEAELAAISVTNQSQASRNSPKKIQVNMTRSWSSYPSCLVRQMLSWSRLDS